MMHRPWDCAQPDEWLPRNLRLCWGGDSSGDGGGGFGDGGFGGGFGDGGFGGAATGGGDWGSSGAADLSGFDAGGIGGWGGTAYDASTFGTGAGLGGDWGSFSATNYSGFDAPNPSFADIGSMYGATTGGGDWGSAGSYSAAGTGGGPGGSMFGADTGGGLYGGSGGGGPFGDYGGGGGGYGGGGGGKGGGGGGGPFSSGGGRGAVTDSTPGYIGTVSGGKDVTPSEVSSPYADDTGPTGRGEQEGPQADPEASPEAPSSFGTPSAPEAPDAPEAPEAPSAPSAPEAPSQSGARSETPSAPSAFGPNTLGDIAAAVYGPESSPDAIVAAGQLADQATNYSQAADIVAADLYGDQPASQPDAPYAGPFSGPDVVGERSQTETGPDFNQAFENFSATPGWDPAEQTAGRAGLAEPTDWAANPYLSSTDVSVGRDFDQVFADVVGQPDYQGAPYADMGLQAAPDFNQTFQALDTPTGMDLAGDFATGRTTDLSNQLGLNDLTVGPGLPSGPAFGISGMNLNTLTHDPQQALNVEIVQAPQQEQPAPQEQPQTPQALPEVQVQAPQEAPQTPQEMQQQTPQEAPQAQAQPQEAPQAQPQEAPQAQPQEQQAAPQAQPQETEQAQPQEAPALAPSLVEMAQQLDLPTQETQPAQPGLITMLPPGGPAPQVQPSETPFGQPGQPTDQADHDAPEPADIQPQGDPNAPRPPGNIPGQLVGQNGQYDNAHADSPQGSRAYVPGGRTAYTQGRPGIDFRTVRQSGVVPNFRTHDINIQDLDTRLVENINRAIVDMERAGIPNTLVATSGMRYAERDEALEHMNDPRTSQASVYSRANPRSGRGFAAAPPGRSNHGHGRAIDFSPSQSGRALTWLRANAGRYGLETLGRNFDIPHIQLQGARGNVGARPSAQEQAEQRALDAQNRQAAIDAGLIGGGRGQQQAAVPMPRGRPGDAPQQQAEAEQAPTETALPPDIPAPRPPADIPAPAPFLAPPARGRADPALLERTADLISREAAKGLTKASGQADFTVAANKAAANMAKAGIPANVAHSVMLAGAMKGLHDPARGNYKPTDLTYGIAVKAINDTINAALQGYQPAKPGEVQGPYGFQPDAPAAPGKQGALPFGQQFAGLSQSLGPVAPGSAGNAGSMTGRTGEIGAQQPMFSIPGLDRLSPIIAPPVPPDQPANPREQASLFDLRFLAKGGHVADDEPVVVGEEGPELFVPDQPGTVVPHMPQPGKIKGRDVDRWPKIPAPAYPGRYGGVEREILRQTRDAQNPMPGLMEMIDSGRLPLNAANWQRMLTDPNLIALGQARMEDRRQPSDYGAWDLPTVDRTPNEMSQQLGYDAIRKPSSRVIIGNRRY